MSQSTGPASRSVEVVPPSPGSLEARASLTLKVLAGIAAVGLALAALPGGAPAASLYTATSIMASAAMTVLYIAEAVGLDRQRPWALAAVRPMLVVVTLIGLTWMADALARGTFRVPFEAALAIWAWLGPADDREMPSLGGRSAGLVGGTIALAAVVLAGPLVFGWGGALDVRAADLHGSVGATCSLAGAELPGTLTVTYDWSWSAGSPFPSGLDIVVIGWTGADSLGRPLYLLDTTPTPSTGVHPGRTGPPSFDMAQSIAAESAGSWRWGVELSEQQLRPGRIELHLLRAREAPPGPRALTIKATYIHVGLWRSDAEATCSW